jgi:hypothetical protein
MEKSGSPGDSAKGARNSEAVLQHMKPLRCLGCLMVNRQLKESGPAVFVVYI